MFFNVLPIGDNTEFEIFLEPYNINKNGNLKYDVFGNFACRRGNIFRHRPANFVPPSCFLQLFGLHIPPSNR